MTNVWGFFLQTLSVSAVALVLLIIKRLFLDKISPNVQYALWLVLALRILLPVRAGVSILFPVPVWVELLKAKIERHLNSAYSSMHELTGNPYILPVYRGRPVSVTDWLFVIYGIGIVAVLTTLLGVPVLKNLCVQTGLLMATCIVLVRVVVGIIYLEGSLRECVEQI